MNKEKTVTMEIPISLLKACEHGNVSNNLEGVHELFREARKLLPPTKYEKWSMNRSLPWVGNRVLNGEVECTSPDGLVDLCSVRLHPTGKLIAAAPDLLEVLIWARKSFSVMGSQRVGDAIRAALPKDVADEVLGDE
jgi:hypothetical protein